MRRLGIASCISGPDEENNTVSRRRRIRISPAPPGVFSERGIEAGLAPGLSFIAADLHFHNTVAPVESQALDFVIFPFGPYRTRLRRYEERAHIHLVHRLQILSLGIGTFIAVGNPFGGQILLNPPVG